MMKSQKITDTQWRINAGNGNYAWLNRCFDGWEVSVYRTDGSLIRHGGIHDKRFDAKVEAERLLNETT
jgi:hypothetical protein